MNKIRHNRVNEAHCDIVPLNLPFGTYLVQSGLGHRVVLDGQPLLVACELAEYVGQSPGRVWELILQRIVMFLLQDAAWKPLPNKVFHWLQGRRRPTDPHNHCVAVTKPGRTE